ncbi:hypothetical protein BR93DRAFT_985774 [Coniochaeta sp. PMI_546]|nr:hypothetical protein BR93DRAFT_985774 [Coniochaeta sp. PMI_546]
MHQVGLTFNQTCIKPFTYTPESLSMPESTPGVRDGSSPLSQSANCPRFGIDELVNNNITGVLDLARNEPSIASGNHVQARPETVIGQHNHQHAIPEPVRNRDTPAGTAHDTKADKHLRKLLRVETRDDYDREMARFRAYRKRKSMRRTEHLLARVHGIKDKREHALSRQDREDFSDGSAGSNEELPQITRPNRGNNKCKYHVQCPRGGKDDIPCWGYLLPTGAYIPQSDILDLSHDPPPPPSCVTDYRKHSHAPELKLATEALVNTLAHFADLIPLEIRICIQNIRTACDKEGDQVDDSTLDAFARFILEWAKFSYLSDNIAFHLNGNFVFGGWSMKMQNWLCQAYGSQIFRSDEAKMAAYTSQARDHLAANWPTYHWVVSSGIVTLAMHCRNYHEARHHGARLPADWVFPQPFYPGWARWHLDEKWKGCALGVL